MDALTLPFLSEENVQKHIEYLCYLKRRRDALVGGKSALRNTGRHYEDPVIPLTEKIRAHELFFSSFDRVPKRKHVAQIRRTYPSEDSFLFEVTEAARRLENGTFLYLFSDRGRVKYLFSNKVPLASGTLLAVDLYEHAYFCDYGFDRDRYLRAALAYLSLWKLDQNV